MIFKIDGMHVEQSYGNGVTPAGHEKELSESQRQAEISFWWKGRKPVEPRTGFITLSKEDVQADLNAKREAHRAQLRRAQEMNNVAQSAEV